MGGYHTEDGGDGFIGVEGEFRHFAMLHLFPHGGDGLGELVVGFLVDFSTLEGGLDFGVVLFEDGQRILNLVLFLRFCHAFGAALPVGGDIGGVGHENLL